MKRITCMLLLGCGASGFAYGQAQEPAPKPMPDVGKLFQFPTTPQTGKPHFKLQIPGNGEQGVIIPRPVPLHPPVEEQPLDRGILRKPHGFAQREARPAERRNLYPDLKVLPIEMAQLEQPGTPVSPPRLEPIPRVWLKAKVEPIPTTWQGYRMVPIAAAVLGTKPNK